MKTLENLFTLSHKVTVYVPATKNDESGSHLINNEGYVSRVASLLCSLFGGATASDAIGFWYSDIRSQLEKENTTVVFAFAENLNEIEGENKINFKWMLANTPENEKKIIREIKRRANR